MAGEHRPRTTTGAWPVGDRERDRQQLRGRCSPRLAKLDPGSPGFVRLRAQIIEDLLPLATHLAARFRNRGEPFDDLVQVANLALIKAVDGFDPDRGVELLQLRRAVHRRRAEAALPRQDLARAGARAGCRS